MKMQSISMQNNNNNNGAPTVVQTPQPLYAQASATSHMNSPVGTPYQDYEFVDQSSTPVSQLPVTYDQQYVEAKSAYPDVRRLSPESARLGQQDQMRRYIRAERPQQPTSLPSGNRSFGIFGFFQRIFSDVEGETVAKAIIDESRRITESEEALENEQVKIDRQERKEAWERIERLTPGEVKVAAIQAEMSRSSNHCAQASERRQTRARQRDAGREELTQYRSQRAKVQVLQALAYSATALFIFKTIWGAVGAFGCRPPQKVNSGQKVFVAKSSPSENAPGSSAPAQSSQSQSRRSCW